MAKLTDKKAKEALKDSNKKPKPGANEFLKILHIKDPWETLRKLKQIKKNQE